MDESRIPNVAFEYNSKTEEKWDVHKREGRCEVRTGHRPNPRREDVDDDDDDDDNGDNVENVKIHILHSVIFFFENLPIGEIKLKNIVTPDRPQMTI
jgi:hypothetical protein